MEYAIYPFDYMRITQRHDQGNHLAHWYPDTNYSDKPWDEACKDRARSYFVPGNDYKVVQIIGLNTGVTNTVRLETVNKVKIPYKKDPVILEITLTHIDEEDLKKVKVGQIIHKGEKILREGKDGATAIHLHCTANIGKYYGLKKNSNSTKQREVWVYCYEKSLLPNEAFYVDPTITNMLDSNYYTFEKVPVIYKKGDSGKNIEKICDFLSNLVKGNYYGDYCEACVSVYKKKHNISGDGSTIDEQTLEAMKKEGLKL